MSTKALEQSLPPLDLAPLGPLTVFYVVTFIPNDLGLHPDRVESMRVYAVDEKDAARYVRRFYPRADNIKATETRA